MGVSRTRHRAGRDGGLLARRRQLPQVCRLAVMAGLLAAASVPRDPRWTQPVASFPILGPISYVGTAGLAAYLIRTRAGAILLDGTLAQNVPAIERSLAAQGVRLRDIRLLLNSHAHFDHAAGLAQLKRDTGARLDAGAEDAVALRTGMPPGETDYGVVRFPPVAVDRAVPDGGTVRLGEVTLTRIATPGHTPGDSSWAMRVSDPRVAGGRPLDVLFLGSLTVAGNRLIGNRRYPAIVADFRRSFARLATVHADVVLTAHPEIADVAGRQARGGGAAFLDPALLPMLVEQGRAAFEAELARQQAAAR